MSLKSIGGDRFSKYAMTVRNASRASCAAAIGCCSGTSSRFFVEAVFTICELTMVV